MRAPVCFKMVISLWFLCLGLKTFLASFLKILKTGFLFLHQSITSKRENISPDYPLTLLEGLTTISHFCLLEQPNQSKKVNCFFFPSLRQFSYIVLSSLGFCLFQIRNVCMYVMQTCMPILMPNNRYANNASVCAIICANVCM